MARHRQKSDSEFVLTPRGRLLRGKDVQIDGSVNERDESEPRNSDDDQSLSERHSLWRDSDIFDERRFSQQPKYSVAPRGVNVARNLRVERIMLLKP